MYNELFMIVKSICILHVALFDWTSCMQIMGLKLITVCKLLYNYCNANEQKSAWMKKAKHFLSSIRVCRCQRINGRFTIYNYILSKVSRQWCTKFILWYSLIQAFNWVVCKSICCCLFLSGIQLLNVSDTCQREFCLCNRCFKHRSLKLNCMASM